MPLFDVYRKMFASRDNTERVVWWYCGFVVSRREGLGEIPLTQAETIMVYRTRDVDDDTFTIDWTEVGVFRDLVTGDIMDGWFNPFADVSAPHPRSFVDGPATFTVTRAGDGIDIHLVQHNAHVEGVRLDVGRNTHSLGLVQTETKTRTYHRPDGTLPPLDGPEATHIDTVLSIWSPLAAVDDAAVGNAPCRGYYTSGSSGGKGTGAWASTSVRGVMQKAGVADRVNPIAWDRLRMLYPDFFRDGRIAPAFD